MDLQSIDIAYLKTLYSDKVYYGMEINKAIKIMAKEIYKRLGGAK